MTKQEREYQYELGEMVKYQTESTINYGIIIDRIREKVGKNTKNFYIIEIDQDCGGGTEKIDEYEILVQCFEDKTPIENMTVGRLLRIIDKRMYDNIKCNLHLSGSTDSDYYGCSTGHVSIQIDYRP